MFPIQSRLCCGRVVTLLSWSTLLALSALSGCASLPPGHVVSALYGDLRQSVELRESSEWVIDRVEIDAIASTVMRSACQVDAATQQTLGTWLDAQIALEGGPSEAMFQRDRDADLDAVLTLERVAAALTYAQAHQTECPFWLQPRSDFDGVQTDSYRVVVLAESVGGGGFIIGSGKAGLGGGGGARVSLAVGINQRYTLGIGAEAGGIGSFANPDGSGSRTLVGRFSAAIPLFLRIRHNTRFVDLELAATGRWSAGDVRVPPGLRAAIGYGITTVRLGAFMPTATLLLSLEALPGSSNGLPPEYLVLIGTKVGVDIDP